MNKVKRIYLSLLVVLVILTITMTYMTKTFAVGLYTDVSGKAGSYTLIYYDGANDKKISCADANKKYGARRYAFHKVGNKVHYFHDCKEITEKEYETGYSREDADIRAENKGDAGIRVSTTAEAKAAIDYIYKGLRTGEFYLEFSPNENINWNEVENYYLKNYGVTNYKQNYYTYAIKGEFEPGRYGLTDKGGSAYGTILIEGRFIRITSDEKKIAEAFVNKLLPYLQGDGSDYQKVLATYNYIVKNTSYFVDDGFDNYLASNTSIYDVFIEKESTCIGYSIAFSYIMDKLGIESYIVDQIVTNDPNKEEFESVHTYNIVKLDGKFYIADLTGGKFLTGLSSSTLYDNKLNISTSSYNFNGKSKTYNFESGLYNKILSQVKSIKTTTTKQVRLTTTTTKITNSDGKGTTKRITTQPRKTTTFIDVQRTTTTTETHTPGNTTSTTSKHIAQIPGTNKTTMTPTTEDIEYEEEPKENKIFVNAILIIIAILIIVFYIIYKIINNNTKKNVDKEIDDILTNHYNQRK